VVIWLTKEHSTLVTRQSSRLRLVAFGIFGFFLLCRTGICGRTFRLSSFPLHLLLRLLDALLLLLLDALLLLLLLAGGDGDSV
jgi:hypothetical protein